MESGKSISGCAVIDQLIESSKTLESGERAQWYYRLEWIPLYSELEERDLIRDSTSQTIYYSIPKQTNDDGIPRKDMPIMLLLLGANGKCIQESILELAIKYSLPTQK